jgi:hypothetical protein
LIAAIALLFTVRYPLASLIWWLESTGGDRLVVYVALMTDRYQQFRLDQGSIDVEGPAQPLRQWAGASLDDSAAEA